MIRESGFPTIVVYEVAEWLEVVARQEEKRRFP
jgi:hypothetical protein